MNPAAPQIGFDRFIKLEWASAALRVRAGAADIAQLNELLEASHPGAAARKKTRTVLNRLWLEPRPDLATFADRGARIWRDAPDTPVAVLTWGMAIATYPFFGKVAEIVGRLTALQGDCASAELHRRMSEIYGEREGTRRMTNMALQSQSDWGTLDRINGGKRLARKPKTRLADAGLAAWLVESCVRYAGRPLSVATLDAQPVIYPFELNDMLAYTLANAAAVELRSTGGQDQVVDVKADREKTGA